MTDLTVDWLWLYLQIGILGAIVWREMSRPTKRNLYAILVPSALLILVHFQTWWTFNEFSRVHDTTIDHLYNTIDLSSARLANLYIGLATLAFAMAFWAACSQPEVVRREDAPSAVRPNAAAYALVLGWTVVAGYFLVRQAGGALLALTQPGRLIEGQTVFIIAVGLAKWPLIERIAVGEKPRKTDALLWALALFMTLINSRFLTAFAVLQLLIVVHYCRREVSRKLITAMVLPAVGIFIVFGLYRDYAFRFGTVGGAEAAHEFLSRPGEWNVVDWFYRTNVEGFTGFAGELTYQKQGNPFNYDIGLSELSVFTKLVPNSWRANQALPFGAIAKTLDDAYPHSGSVVASGIELAYGHFGMLGPILYCGLLGYLTRWLDQKARRPSRQRLALLIVSVQLLNGVRGSLFFAIVFFGLGDLVTFALYRGFVALTAPAAVPRSASAATS